MRAIQSAGPSEPALSPTPVRRVVHAFDFEEHDTNPEPIPRFWVRAQHHPPDRERPRFPLWNAAAFDFFTAASGRASVYLPTKGGSTSLRLIPGAVPIFPGADYAVTALVRTDRLTHARAVVAARFLDQRGEPLPASGTRSPLVLSQPGSDDWTPVTLHLRGEFDAAAFLQIDLELLQPRELHTADAVAEHHVWLEDVRGGAWFDDVVIHQIPRVELSTTAPYNLVRAPDRPVLRLRIQDLAPAEPNADGPEPNDADAGVHTARLTVYDLDGRTVFSHTLPVPPGGRTFDTPADLPAFGWYRATLEILHQAAAGHAECQFLWLAPIDPPVSPRFGLIDEESPLERLEPLPHLAALTGAGFAVLPAMDEAKTLLDHADTLDALLASHRTITLSLPALPHALADDLRIPSDNPLALAEHDPSLWLPYFLPLIDRYGQSVVRWQIGRTDSDGSARTAAHPTPGAAAARLRAALSTLVPGPVVSVAWPIEHALPAFASDGANHSLDALTLLVTGPGSFGTPHDAVPAWLASPEPRPELTVAIDPRYPTPDRRAAVGDLMRGVVAFWDAFSDVPASAPDTPAAPARVALIRPWSWSPETRPQLAPEPELAVWRTLISTLDGRRVVGELPAVPGIRCFILSHRGGASATLDASGTGALIAWHETADSHPDAETGPIPTMLHGYFGDGPLTLIDAFGNRTPLLPGTEAAIGHGVQTIAVPITPTPVVVEGIDPLVAQFTASFRIDPGFVPAISAVHEHNLVLTNPWPVRITGEIRIVEPGGGALRDGPRDHDVAARKDQAWNITPRTPIPFAIAAGTTERLPFSFSFGPAQEAGERDIAAVVTLDADRPYPPMRLRAPLQVGLEGLDLVPELRLVPSSADDPEHAPGDAPRNTVVALASITNRGDHPRTFDLEAAAPGFPRQHVAIADLQPGETVARRFIFRDAAAALSGRRVRLSLSDRDSPERLNKSLTVP